MRSFKIRWKDKRILTLQNQNINLKFQTKLYKFVAKLRKFRILFKDILTCLGIYKRDASLFTSENHYIIIELLRFANHT